jgi:hypothetical protein
VRKRQNRKAREARTNTDPKLPPDQPPPAGGKAKPEGGLLQFCGCPAPFLPGSPGLPSFSPN